MSALIDKTIIRNIVVEHIDLERFMASNPKKKHISFSSDKQSYITYELHTDEELELDYIILQDDFMFHKFELSYVLDKGMKIYYTELNLTINTKENSESNYRALTVSEYRNKLEAIRRYLEQMYGVYINYEVARIHTIEINKTIETSYSFHDYIRLFRAINDNADERKYRKLTSTQDRQRRKYETIYFTSSIQKLKIYDKKEQLKQCFNIIINNEAMRVEYTLSDYDKIKECLTSDRLMDLSQENVDRYFTSSIKEDIVKSIDKEIDSSNKKLEKLYKQIRKKYKRAYIREFSHRANSICFDMQQIVDIASNDMKKTCRYKKYYDEIDEIILDTNKNNLLKYQEIVEKLLEDDSKLSQK